MRSMHKMAAVAVLAMVVQSTVAAQVQFYNGDPNGGGGHLSEMNPALGVTAMVFENYTVGASGLTITGLFGNFGSATDPAISWTDASWEIRSGITPGNGGTLLFSGTSSASQTGTGIFLIGNEIYTAAVGGLNFFLPAGEYWFGLAPHRSGTAPIFLMATSGSFAVNGNLDGTAFHHFPVAALNYASISGSNFSLGVEGRLGEATSTVPEPATMTLLATGLAGLAGARRRNRTKG